MYQALNSKIKLKQSVIATAFILLMFVTDGFAQLSPGDLSEAHSHLEGMSHCTDCHTFGEKVSNDKCLACHKNLKSRIDQNKGYHSSKKYQVKNA